MRGEMNPLHPRDNKALIIVSAKSSSLVGCGEERTASIVGIRRTISTDAHRCAQPILHQVRGNGRNEDQGPKRPI